MVPGMNSQARARKWLGQCRSPHAAPALSDNDAAPVRMYRFRAYGGNKKPVPAFCWLLSISEGNRTGLFHSFHLA